GFTGLLASVNGAGPGTGYTVSEMVPAGFFATTPTVFSTDLLSRQELVALPDQAMLPDSVRTTINFDNVDASGGPISGAALQSYLNQLGVTITDITPSGLGQIVDDRFGFPSQVLRAFTDTNVFWHDSPNDPYSYTLNFATPQVSFDFIRPELFSSTPSGLIVAPWRARAFDRYGNLLDTVSEPQLAFLGTVPPVAFVLNGPEIASVIFDRTIPNTVATLNRVPTDNWTFDVPTDPRREVLVGTELMFGNAREEVSVVGRHVFYNNSALDGNDPAANPGDDGAIAPGKTVLLPTGIVGPSNYSSYSRGINGIMVDINNLTAAPTVADFGIRINSASAPNTWSVGPNPVISVRLGAGVGGSDRVTLIWSDGAIINRWLEVTVKSDLSGGGLGLPTDDVFYFGNVVGDSDGDRDVDEDDFAAVLGEFGPAVAGLTSDFNADGRVNLTDFIILRSNFDNTLAIPTFPAPAPVAAAAPVAATSTPLVSQPLDVIDENYVSDRNRDSSVIAPSLQAAPVLDLLGESLLAGEYVPQAQATVPAPAMQFAATTEYDLRPLDNDMMADGEGDDLLADILAESMLALVL
ncbi:MAG: hypothetical protein HN350_21645, partial [Phycisphaerales bacterium]|nr:hypothetical protein [Phycisphaerales bacterium]